MKNYWVLFIISMILMVVGATSITLGIMTEHYLLSLIGLLCIIASIFVDKFNDLENGNYY